MTLEKLKNILSEVANGTLSVEKALSTLKALPFEDIHYAHVDHHRSIRKGFPEVIFGQGKTSKQIIGIMDRMRQQENVILVTRIDREKAMDVISNFPDVTYDSEAHMLIWNTHPIPIDQGKGLILVLSAGTSDIPVAREAFLTAKAMGNNVESAYDVGVAGIHRLFDHSQAIDNANVLIVVAGMEGALPSVVAGLVDKPVIAVPTSIGYGVSFGGLTALFAMLNSCASNVAVVNIDNGFGAGYLASIINRKN